MADRGGHRGWKWNEAGHEFADAGKGADGCSDAAIAGREGELGDRGGRGLPPRL